MIAEPNPAAFDLDLDALDDALIRSIEQASAASGRLVLRRGGVPIALVVPVAGLDAHGGRTPDWPRIRSVLSQARDRFADVPADDLDAASIAAAEEAGDEVWRERAGSE